MIPGGIGAYSDSRGALGIRQEVANYIKERDGLATAPNPDHIFLTGAGPRRSYTLFDLRASAMLRSCCAHASRVSVAAELPAGAELSTAPARATSRGAPARESPQRAGADGTLSAIPPPLRSQTARPWASARA